jgi:hypothetical protein
MRVLVLAFVRGAALAWILTVLVFSGCVLPSGPRKSDEPAFMFGGAFNSEASSAERQALLDHLRGEGAIVESTADLPPSHFGARAIARERCDALREWTIGQTIVRDVGPCAEDPNFRVGGAPIEGS